MKSDSCGYRPHGVPPVLLEVGPERECPKSNSTGCDNRVRHLSSVSLTMYLLLGLLLHGYRHSFLPLTLQAVGYVSLKVQLS